MADAFYLPLGEGRFQPTGHTAGPWTPEAQHFGPPSALLVRALEQVPAERAALLGRVTVEILGPAPLTELTVRAGLERPGRSVELLTAELVAGGRPVARASAWRLATSDTSAIVTGAAEPPPSPESCPAAEWPADWTGGYLHAMDWRLAAGSVLAAGPATVWARQRVALVDGEKPSPLQRLCTVADSGNGVSHRLDPRSWWFINAELTVHTHREPVGEWIGLDAVTLVGPQGVGTATSTLHDTGGQVGTGTQALLVRPR
ncbi:thioesterase superfamily protein [Prauserella shujinwangii]|uniref:Thioesterase superfamily protein n=1 Tax=Prauserella shujinwangii TaxID=1453103 RepID=A0A2T0LPC5_9PSEU|nr:thioesterase family protein [Prauserella shujinwangii]PRX45078.1 thioesterase superfamily protein [Prauserella shujinwangii]